MATSGQLNTNTTYDSYFWVRWSQASQDVASNKTRINWSCGVYCGHSFYSNAIKMSALSINGVQVYGGGTYSNYGVGDHTIANGTLDIAHNADGTKTFSISSFTGWLYSDHNYSSNGGSYALTNIPRQATITEAPHFTDLQNPTITYSNPAGDAVSALEACISFTGNKSDIAYRAISKTGSSYTFNLTDAERDVLRNNTPGKERSVIFFVRTTIGNNIFYSQYTRTLSIEESAATKPTVSMTTSPVSTLSEPFKSLYIQGKSRVKAALNVSTKYGATIASSNITVEGVSYASPYESAVLTKDGTQSIIATVKDSRGFSGTASIDIPVISYSSPSIQSAVCYRSDGNGNKTGSSTSLWIKAKRSYNTVGGRNTCAMQWRFKPSSGSWNEWSDLLSKSDTATDWYDALVPGEFNPMKSYTVQVRVIDDIGDTHTKNFDIPTEDVALHLGKGGKNVAVGTYCDYSTEHTFRSAWDAVFDKSINGIYMHTVRVSGQDSFHIKTKFDALGDHSNVRQSFFIFGAANFTPTLGIGFMAYDGRTDWSGTTGVVLTPVDGGYLNVKLPVVAYDYFTVISAEPFSIAYSIA